MAQRGNMLTMFIMLQFTLLIIEFLLGMYLNLFSTISFPVSMGNSAGTSVASIAPHMAVGVIIFILSILIAFYAAKSGNPRITLTSVLGLIFVLLTGISGYLFVFQSGSALLSFTMAIGFILTLVIYMVPVSIMMRTSSVQPH